jgi:hypothetical protein
LMSLRRPVGSGGQDEANQEPDLDAWCLPGFYQRRCTKMRPKFLLSFSIL